MKTITPPDGPKRTPEETFWRKRPGRTIIPASLEVRIYTNGGIHLMAPKQDAAAQLLPGEKQTWQFGEMKITIERAASEVVSIDELQRRKKLQEEQP